MQQQQPCRDKCAGLLRSMRSMQLPTSVLLPSVRYRHGTKPLQATVLPRLADPQRAQLSTCQQKMVSNTRHSHQALPIGTEERLTGTKRNKNNLWGWPIITENLCHCFFKEQNYWQNLEKQQYMGNRKQVLDGSMPFMCSRKRHAQQVLQVSKITEHTNQEKPLSVDYHRTRERHTECRT